MSQEQPPIRSRRELRKARDAAQGTIREASPTGAGEVAPASNQAGSAASGRIRRVAPGPVDSVPGGQAAERSSQIRARDRAALRTIKELAEKEGQLSGGGPPTRRQLRLMELEKAVTSAIPVLPPASGQPAPAAPANGKTTAAPAVPDRPAASARPADQGQPAAQAPAQPTTAPKAAAETAPGIPSELPDGMTVEQALEARALIAEQAKNQIAKMEHIAATDPDAVDPEILAQQIALAERAAILNKRAMAKQKLAEKNTPSQPNNGPSTASNLAMVTPLEFVQVPGVDGPVMKRPATSYVPVVTNPGPRVPARGSKLSKAPRSAGSAPSTGRSGVIARAEAAARAAASPTAPPAVRQSPAGQSPAPQPAVNPSTALEAESNEEFAALPPVSAQSAYGLDPLDAATAGLGRANRLRLLQVGVLALGVIALIAGIIMIISGLSR
ncbi:MAG: hypothetical protein M3127_10195 [Actinomycetota bacterium]|nr:hypothetical protein [Actinomycetota bacterium]